MSLDKARNQDPPLTDPAQLVRSFRDAERPSAQHKVGLEHEKLLFGPDGLPVPYEGAHGIGQVLESLTAKGYLPFRESPGLPAIALELGKLTVSLEPGGQLELSGTAVGTAREAHAENLRHLEDLKQVTGPMGLRIVTLGYRPFGQLAQMPWMPKSRYRVMRETLGSRGRLALDMMLMTSTGQVSLDWSGEEDCARKVTAVARLTPLMVALYANSPLAQGKDSGYLSFRSRVWSEVDPARCGYFPEMIDGSFRYQSYVDWALAAPMLFLRRAGQYLQPKMTFRQFMAQGFEGHPALEGDWSDHLSTLFPEVRLKTVLEVRGADGVSPALTGALPALWRGLLYDPAALTEAEALLPRLGFEAHLDFHDGARREGLRSRVQGLEVRALALELVRIARRGLQRLDPQDAPLLDPLEAVAESGRSPAEAVLETWNRTRDPEAVLATSRIG
ncbi:MAG: glutamate-cysteine ligase family protein [Myxococcota bacterium]|nr:glutamate-cysteine ligase family protein [Myxococcota bacterium]